MRRAVTRYLRIPTVNPPGNERPAAERVADFLREHRLEPKVVESDPTRANVIARYAGPGQLPPLLLTGHLDVVEADAANWKRPPFSADVAEGCLWGRGAIDMKNMAAMCACVMWLLARQKPKLERDVIFAAVADEETGSANGARFLVEQHPDLVRAEYAIGESGGFSLHLGARLLSDAGRRKGPLWVRARITGEAGHGSMPRADSVVIQAGEALVRARSQPAAGSSDRRRAPTSSSALRRAAAGAVRSSALRQAGAAGPAARSRARRSRRSRAASRR